MMRRLLAALLCLCAWVATGFAQQGQIVDATTGLGIGGATVTLGDHIIQTDKDGRFQADAGNAPVMARAPGYRAVTMAATKFWGGDARLQLTPFQPKALYLSFYGVGNQAIRDAALKLIQEAKLNALVIDVKGDRGMIAFHSDLPLAQAVGAQRIITIPDLPALLRSLHDSGLYAIARIVVFKDDPLATTRPDLAVRLQKNTLFRDREHLAWTDPTLKEVRDYNIGIAIEAARAGFDEIQFDYLRFPDAPSGAGFAKPTTEASRLDAIGAFLAEARRQLVAFNVFLAADIFGYVCWNPNDTGIGQRLEEIMPHVDYLSPMLYPSGFQYGIPGYANPIAHPYEIVRLSLERARARLGVAPNRFRPWLQAFRDYAFDRHMFAAGDVAAQIRAATDFGSDGWMLWNPRNTYGDTGLADADNVPSRRGLDCF